MTSGKQPVLNHFADDRKYAFLEGVEADEGLRELSFAGSRWEARTLQAGSSAYLRVISGKTSSHEKGGGAARLRIALADDLRGEAKLHAELAEDNGERVGSFDIRYGYKMQMFEIPLSEDEASRVMTGGIRLVAEGMPLSIIERSLDGETAVFAPHLFHIEKEYEPSIAMFLRHLASSTAYYPSGWMEGCVLEGLYDLYAATGDSFYLDAARRHLAVYSHDKFDNPQPLRQATEGPRVVKGRIVADVIEETLPIAVLARLDARHPAIDAAVAGWLAMRQENDAIFDNETRTITTEGAYTAAYPMAVVASLRGDLTLARLALRQLLSRRDGLASAEGICLRRNYDTGEASFLNWNRGCAWYLLGWVKTWSALRSVLPPEELEEARSEFRRAAELAAKYQHSSGLWHGYWHRPESGLETSGSAGIAAALAIGAEAGLLDARYGKLARKAWRGLQLWISGDGMLAGAAQTNQGGEALQMSGYRTLFAAGMGLVAQLGAVLGELDEHNFAE